MYVDDVANISNNINTVLTFIYNLKNQALQKLDTVSVLVFFAIKKIFVYTLVYVLLIAL